MPLAEDNTNNRYTITAYEANSITVSEKEYSKSIVLSPNHLTPWDIQNIAHISEANCSLLLDTDPQVVIIGTGEQQLFPKPEIYAFFAQHQIGLEVMANHAACRTFNILAAEGREVVAGFILQPA